MLYWVLLNVQENHCNAIIRKPPPPKAELKTPVTCDHFASENPWALLKDLTNTGREELQRLVREWGTTSRNRLRGIGESGNRGNVGERR